MAASYARASVVPDRGPDVPAVESRKGCDGIVPPVALLVQKFGGTSVADPDRIREVADHVVRCRKRGDQVVLVVSAMGKETDELLRLAKELSSEQPGREMDMLITAGERKAVALVAMALVEAGVPSESYTGSQAGFITDTNHTNAKIVEVKADRIRAAVDAGVVPVVAGAQGVAIQLIDQSPIAFDDVVFRDLTAAHASRLNKQVIGGTGTNGQVLGTSATAGIGSLPVTDVTIQGVYSAIANAIQTVHTTRFLPPEVIVMHPRRWGWFLSLLDTTDRPLFLPGANNGMNLAGVLSDVASQQVVGQMHGLPVVTDPGIPINVNGDEDVIYVLRSSDLVLWESGIRARVLPETKAQNLTVLLQIYSYLAFSAARYPQSVVEISGLTAPSW